MLILLCYLFDKKYIISYLSHGLLKQIEFAVFSDLSKVFFLCVLYNYSDCIFLSDTLRE